MNNEFSMLFLAKLPVTRECTPSGDSELQAARFKSEFRLIRFMFMQPSVGSMVDAAARSFSV